MATSTNPDAGGGGWKDGEGGEHQDSKEAVAAEVSSVSVKLEKTFLIFFFRNKKRRQSITSAGLRALVYTVFPTDTVKLVRRILSFLL